jgi:glutaminase
MSSPDNNKKNPDQGAFSDAKKDLKPLFDSILEKGKSTTSMEGVIQKLEEIGLNSNNLRLEKELLGFLKKTKGDESKIDFDQFADFILNTSSDLIHKVALRKVSIPEFQEFCKDIENIFEKVKNIKEGEVSGKGDKDYFAVSICTVDGQRHHYGDKNEKFLLQSVCKAVNYAIALHECGEEKVHKHVGREPSGRGYNGLILNEENLPHNPMINAGAIMTCSMIKPELTVAKRHQHVMDIWTKLSGGEPVEFRKQELDDSGESNSRNMALAYHMLEKDAYPKDTDIYKTMELYKRCCYIKADVDQLSVVAATLGNGGICPTTGEKVFNSDDIRDCLSLMLSCGMYDYSGEFAFLVGLPAKSGVSGALMVVIPGLMGIAIYSPPIDDMGNTVRGVAFCKDLVDQYRFHIYDHIVDATNSKKDPRKQQLHQKTEAINSLLWAASYGSIIEVQNLLAQGVSPNAANYDQRTSLHLAAAEGHYAVAEYLLKTGTKVNARDRWGKTPLYDAEFGNHTKTASLIRKYKGIT